MRGVLEFFCKNRKDRQTNASGSCLDVKVDLSKESLTIVHQTIHFVTVFSHEAFGESNGYGMILIHLSILGSWKNVRRCKEPVWHTIYHSSTWWFLKKEFPKKQPTSGKRKRTWWGCQSCLQNQECHRPSWFVWNPQRSGRTGFN